MKKFSSKKDYELISNFIIPGNPATKKNSNQIIWVRSGRRKLPKVIPSAQYSRYERHCKDFCLDAWKNKKYDPIDFGILIRINVWLNAWRIPDHVGILQSLGDIFQKWGIVKDDKFIQWTDYNLDSRSIEPWLLGVDKLNPRVEVWIYRYRHTTEQYEVSKNAPKKATRAAAK